MLLKDNLKTSSQRIGLISEKKEELIAFYKNTIEYEDSNLIYLLY